MFLKLLNDPRLFKSNSSRTKRIADTTMLNTLPPPFQRMKMTRSYRLMTRQFLPQRVTPRLCRSSMSPSLTSAKRSGLQLPSSLPSRSSYPSHSPLARMCSHVGSSQLGWLSTWSVIISPSLQDLPDKLFFCIRSGLSAPDSPASSFLYGRVETRFGIFYQAWLR